MAYHEGEGKAFTKPPAVLMCPLHEDKLTEEIICIVGYKEMMFVKSSSKHTKRQPYWFSKCSGIPFGWRGDVCGVPGSKTNGQWQQMELVSTRCPSRCTLWHFPSVLFLFTCTSEMLPSNLELKQITSYYHRWQKTNHNSNNDDNKRIHVRIIGVRSGKVVHPLPWLLPTNRAQCYYQPAQCQLATILVPFKIENYHPALHSPYLN